MPRFRLIPREESFYAQFTAMADQIRGGARLLEEMFAPDPPIADKAYVIETGRIVMSGTATEIANNEDVRKSYLGY